MESPQHVKLVKYRFIREKAALQNVPMGAHSQKPISRMQYMIEGITTCSNYQKDS